MDVSFNNIQDASAAQEQKNSCPVDASKPTAFSAIMQSVSKNQAAPASAKDQKIYKAVSEAAEKYKLPPALILAVIKQESGFNPNAVSSCGAQGLMQLMPQTGKQMGVNAKDLRSIEGNIDGGSHYLRQMLDHFGGDVKKAIAAYNAGPGAVEKYNGVPPFKETQNYVPSVLAHFEKFNGTTDIAKPNRQINLDTVVSALSSSSDLLKSSTMVGALVSNIRMTDLPQPQKSESSNEEPPPPPPPRAMRV